MKIKITNYDILILQRKVTEIKKYWGDYTDSAWGALPQYKTEATYWKRRVQYLQAKLRQLIKDKLAQDKAIFGKKTIKLKLVK